MVPRNPFVAGHDGVDGNRRQKKTPEGGKAYIFRKIRLADGTVLLEPFTDVDRIKMNEGDQFVTGTLHSDPGWTVKK
jgi:hypothetical protein